MSPFLRAQEALNDLQGEVNDLRDERNTLQEDYALAIQVRDVAKAEVASTKLLLDSVTKERDEAEAELVSVKLRLDRVTDERDVVRQALAAHPLEDIVHAAHRVMKERAEAAAGSVVPMDCSKEADALLKMWQKLHSRAHSCSGAIFFHNDDNLYTHLYDAADALRKKLYTYSTQRSQGVGK